MAVAKLGTSPQQPFKSLAGKGMQEHCHGNPRAVELACRNIEDDRNIVYAVESIAVLGRH